MAIWRGLARSRKSAASRPIADKLAGMATLFMLTTFGAFRRMRAARWDSVP